MTLILFFRILHFLFYTAAPICQALSISLRLPQNFTRHKSKKMIKKQISAIENMCYLCKNGYEKSMFDPVILCERLLTKGDMT